jgi:CHAD domain-containing protein
MNAQPALKPGEAVGEALRLIARETLSEAHAIVTDTEREKAVAVHDFRKSMKRWRAYLRLLEPQFGDAGLQLRVQAGDLARSLTSARDASSALEALDDLQDDGVLPSGALSGRSLATVRERLTQMRSASERRVWNERARQRILDYVTAASHQVAVWDFAALTFADVAEGLTRTYRRARKAQPDEWRDAGGDALHELRQRVVIHRYQMELIEPAWPRLGKLWVEEAQRLRNRLGQYQDLVMLAQLAVPNAPLAPWRSRLMPTIAKAQSEHTKAASRLSARLFAESPKAFRRRLEALWEAQDR